LCIGWIIKCLIIIDAQYKHEEFSYHIDDSVLPNLEGKRLLLQHFAACSFDKALLFQGDVMASGFALAAGAKVIGFC